MINNVVIHPVLKVSITAKNEIFKFLLHDQSFLVNITPSLDFLFCIL